MAERQQQHVWHYRPGEFVVAAELAEDDEHHRQAHGLMRLGIERQLAGRSGGVFHAQQRRPRPIVFRAPGRPPLGFFFYDLADRTDMGVVKQVVSSVHAQGLAALQPAEQAGISLVGAMPHWLGSSLQDFGGGSPASLPRPTRPPADGRWRYRYTPTSAKLDLRSRVEKVPRRAHVPVLVLDTSPEWEFAQQQAARFGATNPQLATVVELLAEHGLPDWHLAAIRELRGEALKLTPGADGRSRAYLEADHGLFVSGLIHDLAPRAGLRLRPVLNPWGVGDLHLLLQVLAEELASKPVDQPLIINMSLGFLPKLQHLHWTWYGVDPPDDPDFVRDGPIPGHPTDRRWLAAHRDEVEETTRMLHRGIERMTRYLLANNCLAIAAAGNDSLRRVEHDRQRFDPRVPARYESVLGVAATTDDPTRAARYSNIGDDREFGDHIATFGGDVDDADEPKDGVVGLYSADSFPDPDGGPATPNETGWAMWSGSSFSTGLATGMVANYWATQRDRKPDTGAEAVLLGFNTLADNYAPALRTPSIAIEGEWQRHN
jgi:Subtilase family